VTNTWYYKLCISAIQNRLDYIVLANIHQQPFKLPMNYVYDMGEYYKRKFDICRKIELTGVCTMRNLMHSTVISGVTLSVCSP